MDTEKEEPRRRGWFGRILGLAAIVGAGALWRQHQRDLDEELWGDPMDAADAPREGGTDAATDAGDGTDAQA